MSDGDKNVVTATINVAGLPGEDEQDAFARVALGPVYRAIGTIQLMNANGLDGMPGTDINALVGRLDFLVSEAKNGDTEQIETILIAQAQTLDALFNNLTRKSVMNMGQFFEASESYMKLALRAQANCRVTLECFANLKKPLLKQTNIAHGHQQVNNFPENPPNELLEETDGERLDFGKAATPIRGNTTLETVGEVHGTENA